MLNNLKLMDDKETQEIIDELWGTVFENCYGLIQQTAIFGFKEMDVLPDPNIHQILASSIVIGTMLDTILDFDNEGIINVADTRKIINAKQQILIMKRMATALKNKDENTFNLAVTDLKSQAVI